MGTPHVDVFAHSGNKNQRRQFPPHRQQTRFIHNEHLLPPSMPRMLATRQKILVQRKNRQHSV